MERELQWCRYSFILRNTDTSFHHTSIRTYMAYIISICIYLYLNRVQGDWGSEVDRLIDSF